MNSKVIKYAMKWMDVVRRRRELRETRGFYVKENPIVYKDEEEKRPSLVV